ncbi:MAG: hypothetical protein JRM75_02115 [Nitrososphaerota archaeon]|nr:hypothetical protein [Nitrososphaerota archaeon]
MQYTVRAFVEGSDARIDEICRVFSSMERAAYNLLREDAKEGQVKAVLRDRYGVTNARWCQSATNQAKAAMEAQKEGLRYRIEQCTAKARNEREKMKHVSNPLKVRGCLMKVKKYMARADELRSQLRDGSYPTAVFGSARLLRQLAVARGEKYYDLRREWKEARSNHLFSVGQANQRGNGNTRLSYDDDGKFHLEFRNWHQEDFMTTFHVPEHTGDIIKDVVARASSVRLGKKGGGLLLGGRKGLPYSVRLIRSKKGYQVFVSFELEAPAVVEWTGRIAGVDINPEGLACTAVSEDGNLVATRFLRDSRLITASKNKRKWVLENLVNRMLRWARDTHGCDAIALEELKFKGAYDSSPRTNFKLSNFMKRKMLERIRLSALKMRMLTVGVDPAYTSMVATAKYGRRFGGFNRHQLAAFVIGRRALGYGEAPVMDCLPKTGRERAMWNHSIRHYGHQPAIRTLTRREPLERKNAGDANGGGLATKLLTAPPANTPSQMGSSHSTSKEGVVATEAISRQAGRASPHPPTREGGWARGRRANPPDTTRHQSAVIFHAKEDNAIS